MIEEGEDAIPENCDEPRINVSDSNINQDGDDFGVGSALKECPACTFYNDPGNIICEVCETSLL